MSGPRRARTTQPGHAVVAALAAVARPSPYGDDKGAAALAAALARAEVVGLGVAARGSHELSTIAGDLVRHLVRDHHFRALHLEGDDAASRRLDAFLTGTHDDVDDLLARARPFWRTEELRALLTWLHAYNTAHPQDPVRVLHTTTPHATDGDDLERSLAELTLHGHGRARGARTVHWGGLAHTAVRATATGQASSAGAHLRRALGRDYVSVGLLVGRGAAGAALHPLGAGYAEDVLSDVRPAPFWLDLRTAGAPATDAWVRTPTAVRVVGPTDDPAAHLRGGTLADWLDVLVHVPVVTDAGFLPGSRRPRGR